MREAGRSTLRSPDASDCAGSLMESPRLATIRLWRAVYPGKMDVLDRFLRRWGIHALMASPVFAVTLGTSHHPPIFDDIPFGRECARLLRAACERTDVRLYAYCLMPDHACLVIGLPGRTSLPEIVTAWKSLCAQARRGSVAPSPHSGSAATRSARSRPPRRRGWPPDTFSKSPFARGSSRIAGTIPFPGPSTRPCEPSRSKPGAVRHLNGSGTKPRARREPTVRQSSGV